MDSKSLDYLIAFHCAPTLAGIKPANMFSWRAAPASEMSAATAKNILRGCGVSLEVLCSCERHSLIYIYRRNMLEEVFTPEANEFLEGYGYKSEAGVCEKLDTLKERFLSCGCFPHEIGLFLGYPIEDVRGFIENNGHGYKVCGTWKVYGDKEKSLQLFDRYKRCTEYFCKNFDAGREMAQIVCSAPMFS